MLLTRLAKSIWGTGQEWEPRSPLLKPVKGIDGSELHGRVMCRIINGEAQYRAMTETGIEEFTKDQAW